MKYIPSSFPKDPGYEIGLFYAELSPDGWCESSYRNLTHENISSPEIMEAMDFIRFLMRECRDQDAFLRYMNAHASRNGSENIIEYEGNLMRFRLKSIGYAVNVFLFRKTRSAEATTQQPTHTMDQSTTTMERS